MSRVQFITPEYMYKYTMIESNVDPDLIVKFIYKSQDLNLQSTIGENLYTKLKNNLPNFTGQDLVLVKECLFQLVPIPHSQPAEAVHLLLKPINSGLAREKLTLVLSPIAPNHRQPASMVGRKIHQPRQILHMGIELD